MIWIKRKNAYVSLSFKDKLGRDGVMIVFMTPGMFQSWNVMHRVEPFVSSNQGKFVGFGYGKIWLGLHHAMKYRQENSL